MIQYRKLLKMKDDRINNLEERLRLCENIILNQCQIIYKMKKIKELKI